MHLKFEVYLPHVKYGFEEFNGIKKNRLELCHGPELWHSRQR